MGPDVVLGQKENIPIAPRVEPGFLDLKGRDGKARSGRCGLEYVVPKSCYITKGDSPRNGVISLPRPAHSIRCRPPGCARECLSTGAIRRPSARVAAPWPPGLSPQRHPVTVGRPASSTPPTPQANTSRQHPDSTSPGHKKKAQPRTSFAKSESRTWLCLQFSGAALRQLRPPASKRKHVPPGTGSLIRSSIQHERQRASCTRTPRHCSFQPTGLFCQEPGQVT